MNILWDFRLFSYGYGQRGVGVFTRRMAEAILTDGLNANLFIWAEKDRVPMHFPNVRVQWIEYIPRSWKWDLFAIPLLIWRHRIDIFHYWIGLGPIHRMGMGLFHPCRTCVTVHDLGVECWDEIDHCRAMRKSIYWRAQKMLFAGSDAVVCNSHATEMDVRRCLRKTPESIRVVYAPLEKTQRPTEPSPQKRFVTLSGAANKNLRTVIDAFSVFKRNNPDFSLAVTGSVEEGPMETGAYKNGVTFEPMAMMGCLLDGSIGFICCSIHEGLGLPVLSAMAHGCPVLISDIPVFHETCAEAGRYVDPVDALSIVRGMEDIERNYALWSHRSSEGANRYGELSKHAGRLWKDLYEELVR